MILTSRELPLVLSHGLPIEPTVTVEFYQKWYGLVVVQPNGNIEEVAFPDEGFCKPSESPYADHVPNPAVVMRWAKHHGYEVDPLALELMVGRWELDARNRYEALAAGT